MQQSQRRVATVLVIVAVAFLLVRTIMSLRGEAALVLPPPQEREPFRVDFTLPDMQARPRSLAEFHGRPVLLNFWATWCTPCREEMPSIQALYDAYHPQGVAFLAIATDGEGAAVVTPFLQAHHVTFPVLLDPQNVVGGQLQLPGIPTTYVLDKQGRIAGFALGSRDWHTRNIHQLFEQLLAED